MKRLWMSLVLFSLSLCFLASATFGQQSPALESSVESDQVIRGQQKQADLWPMLQNQRVPGVEAARHAVRINDVDKQWLDADLDDPASERIIGMELPLDLEVDLAEELLASADKRLDSGVGRFAFGEDGMGVWTTSLRAEGATALRLEINKIDLPEGVALYLYNDAEQAHGPYTAQGPHDNGRFWTHTVFGDHVWIQLHINKVDAATLELVRFQISQVGHFGERFGLAKRVTDKADCSNNVSCVQNAECYDWDDILGSAREGVARTVISLGGGWIGRCSGGLLNDTDSSGQKAWFLTAEHCVDEGDITSLESFFQYQSPCGSCSASYVDSVIGASIRVRNGEGDYALLELDDLPSSGVLMGWNNADVQVDTNIYLLSHPKGSPQSLSQHLVGSSSSDKYIYARTVLGSSQGGSSGAPTLNASGKVVGFHSGVTNDDDHCSYSTYRVAEGAMSYFWPSVAPYLKPGQGTYSMHVSDVTVSTKKVNVGFGLKFHYPKVQVTVANSLGHGVSSVIVQGTFSGDVGGPAILTTDVDGVATFTYPVPFPSSPSFSFCVSNLTHGYYNDYDDSSNVETCASR